MTTIILTAVMAVTTIIMTDVPASNSGLLKLMAWLSPAFPVGSFSYSHGLEAAAASSTPVVPAPSTAFGGLPLPLRRGGPKVAAGRTVDPPAPVPVEETGEGGHATRGGQQPVSLVSNADDLRDWLAVLLQNGSAWNDSVLFAEAWRRQRDGGELTGLVELGAALASSHERHLETTLQGAAFATALRNGWPEPTVDLPDPCPYPVAVSAAAAAHGIALEPALSAYLQAFAANLAQAAIRLGITGQAGAVAVIAALEPVVAETARRAAQSSLDDLGSATILSEVMAMRHETHYSRLFRT